MTEKLSKREFVDENPYLVYASEEDTAYSGSGGSGSIPIATADTLGGVKVGSGLSITEAGVLSASGGGGGGILPITVTYDESYNPLSIDVSYNQIVQADIIIIKEGIDSDMSIDVPLRYTIETDDNVYYFSYITSEMQSSYHFTADNPNAQMVVLTD